MAKNKKLSTSNFGNDMEQQECALVAGRSICTLAQLLWKTEVTAINLKIIKIENNTLK